LYEYIQAEYSGCEFYGFNLMAFIGIYYSWIYVLYFFVDIRKVIYPPLLLEGYYVDRVTKCTFLVSFVGIMPK